MKKKLNNNDTSQAVGLDIALELASFITGKSNMHYGIWDNLEINLGNLGAAQEAYTEKVFSYLPKNKILNILDIGGGAGETAKKLLQLGHNVTIIVPSPILASHSKNNTANKANIKLCTFEEYQSDKNELFDLCLFSESFQYIPLREALRKAKNLLNANGQIIVSDCFRSSVSFKSPYRPPGGGHSLQEMYKEIILNKLEILNEEDITKSVSASIDLEQRFYNTLGAVSKRIIQTYSNQHKFIFRIMKIIYNLLLSNKKRMRLKDRLFKNSRNSEVFELYNNYMIFLLRPNI